MAAVLYSRSEAFQGGPVALEFVRDNNSWSAKRLEEIAEESNGGPVIAPRLDEDVQYIAFAINSAPQPILLPINWKDDFVQVPFVRHTGSIPADHLSILRSKFRDPGADGFVADHNTACGEQVLDITQTQGKPVKSPDSVSDDFRRKTMARKGSRLLGFGHAPTYRLLRCLAN